jgi:Flp pilus assembly protein CpaB
MTALRSAGRDLLRPVRRVRRRVLLHRRPLAALTAAGAVLAALQASSPPQPQTTAVWTARRDLPSGTVLGPLDLARSRFAPATVPDGAVADPDDVVGRTLAAPMSRGEVVTRTRTMGPGVLEGYPGTAAVPLRITDAAVAALLRVGDRVSLVAADPDGRTPPRLLLEDVPIVAIPRSGDGALDATPGRLVVAAVPTEVAGEVAGAAATAVLIPVWNR